MDPAEIVILQESPPNPNLISTPRESITNPSEKENFSGFQLGDSQFGESCKILAAAARLKRLETIIAEAVSEGEFELPLQYELSISRDPNTIWILNEHIDVLKKSNLQVHEIGECDRGGKECWISWYPVNPPEQILSQGVVTLHPAEKTVLKMSSKKRKKSSNPLTRYS